LSKKQDPAARVMIAPMAQMFSFRGTEIDYENLAAGIPPFKFRNPM